MPDWSALRRRAYEKHLRLRSRCSPSGALLLSAETLLAAAADETGLDCLPVPPTDPLLSQADAVLDRETGCVWYARGAGIRPDRQRFARAHEFAHFWLHPQIVHDSCTASEDPAAFMPSSSALPATQIETGYSPEERRETEANLFAAELLLPAPLLRELFLHHHWHSARIVAESGLSESCVLAQLTCALLLPYSKRDDSTGSADTHAEIESRKSKIETPLDSSQKAAATIERGPILVDAGPGTGKTRTLVARIRHLLEDREIAPENILALTFSRKAAEEMQTRLRDYVGETAERVWIGTFHAFGLELLRKEGSALDLPLRPRLLETADAIALLERHLDRLNLREFEYLSQPILPFPDILNCIRRAKDELKTPADYREMARRQAESMEEKERIAARKSEEIAHIYAVYQQLLKEYGLLDFSDLLMQSVRLLETAPDVRSRWQTRFRHIVADEYQDINRASARLLQLLAGDGSGLWAVGDLRQAIYRFIGASPANVAEFENDFPGGRRLRLDRNYRSLPSLVSLFSHAAQLTDSAAPLSSAKEESRKRETEPVDAPSSDLTTGPIENRKSKIENPLWLAQRETAGEPEISVTVTEDEEGQADWLAAQIRSWEAAGVPPSKQAILVAVNRHAADLARSLEARGIAAQHLGGLFERAEVKDMLALLSLACEPDGAALTRVATFPEYSVPRTDVTCLLAAARETKRPFPDALALAATLPELSEQGRQGLLRLQSHLVPIQYRGDAWMLLARYLFQTSGYLLPILTAAETSVSARQQLLALYQLLQFAQGQSKRLTAEEGMEAQTAFLHHLRFLLLCGEARITRLPPEADALDGVRLMTVHQSKGLEFPVVYLPNLVKGQFPTRGRSAMTAPPPELTQDDATGDECLFFVALSRARDYLALSRPATWNGKPVAPSPFLEQIEPALNACSAQRITWTSAIHTAPIIPSANNSPSPSAGRLAEGPPNVGACAGQVRRDGAFIDPPDSSPPLSVSVSALEQYFRCPRQYYYQRVAKLPERGEESAYLAYHESLQTTLRWLQTERAEGRNPVQEDVQAQFHSRWSLRKPQEETAHAILLERHAIHLLKTYFGAFSPVSTLQPELELTAELPNGSVRLRCDQAEHLPDGTVRLTRQLHGRAKKEDANEERLALMRLAAQQRHPESPVQIAMHYLREGQIEVVPEKPRFEPNRVLKYDIALKDIRANRFEPHPVDRQCAQCPYHFICPS